ncbi:MAG: hypothetical protein AAFO98_09635 [Pseudomonadota bacterium]
MNALCAAKRALIAGILLASISQGHAIETYLRVSVDDNHFLMASPDEKRRLVETTANFQQRLEFAKPNRRCDPRLIANRFPEPGRRNAVGCSSRQGFKYPAPTNRQFKTKWNPVRHRFDLGYLTGANATKRLFRLNLLIDGPGTFRDPDIHRCDWTITSDGKSETFRDRWCAPFTPSGSQKLKVNTDYVAKAVVRRGNTVLHRSGDMPFRVDDRIVIALGDSFGSGEGNPHTHDPLALANSKDKKPPRWLDPRCHRSLLSSSIQATTILSEDYRDTSFSVANFACSGAETTTGLTGKYTGRATAGQTAQMWRRRENIGGVPTRTEDGFLGYAFGGRSLASIARSERRRRPAKFDLPSQIDQLAAALGCNGRRCTRQPDAVIVYMGVNDIGFASRLIEIVVGCADDAECRRKAKTAVKTGLDEAKSVLRRLPTLMAAKGIRPKADADSIILVTYPNPLTRPARDRRGQPIRGKFRYCNDAENAFGRLDRNAFLGGFGRLTGFTINKLGAKFAAEEILKPLNAMLRGVGNEKGWRVVDTQNSALGHGFCADDRWFNNFLESRNKQGDVPASFIFADTDCSDSSNSACSAVKTLPLPSGAMHPNFFGHNNIAYRLRNELEDLFDLK